jgi:CHAD domain-containing protein
MKTPALKEIKQELENLPASRVMELFLRLIRSRKENKELISYLLFESHNEAGYIESIRHEIDDEFNMLPAATPYLTKKALRKILRIIARYTKQMGSKQAEVELRIYFCRKLKISGIRLKRNTTLENIYELQIKKIRSLVEMLHEDLGHDYKRMLDEL